ncbi:MAG: hypothetical protein ACREVI_16500 [Steroidobacteraceae bacterium]
MKSGMYSIPTSFLAILTAIAMTTLLAASFVESTQSMQTLGGRTQIAPETTA